MSAGCIEQLACLLSGLHGKVSHEWTGRHSNADMINPLPA